jgi:mannose-6-phosphate isomerase-like protein (cupin superfamily)
MQVYKPKVPVVINKVWGKEIIIENDIYCGKLLLLNKNCQCSIHYHKIKTETFYFLSGECLFEWSENNNQITHQFRIPNGFSLKIEPGTLHRFSGIAPLTQIIEVSTFDKASDSIRNTESKYIKGASEKWASFPKFQS